MEGLDIKRFIERVGIRSQEDLAKKLGVSDQTVSNWVKGKTFPTHQMELQMLKMGMTVEELFGYPYPSSVDALREKGALWEVTDESIQNLKKDIQRKR